MQNCNFACCFVWVWSLVSNVKEKTQIEGVWKESAYENIWTSEGEATGGSKHHWNVGKRLPYYTA
jgi:hypothetical protein